MTSDDPADVEASIARRGFAMLRLDAEGLAAAFARRLGPILDITEVRIGSRRTYLSSADAIPPHTDHPAARLILWHCRQRDDGGAGANLLVDAHSAIRALPAPLASALADVELRCPGLRTLAPACTHHLYRPDERQVFYAPWLCPAVRNEALRAFEAEIDNPVHRRRILLQEGDALLINNRRMLHLREALPAGSPRWLTRYWIGDA